MRENEQPTSDINEENVASAEPQDSVKAFKWTERMQRLRLNGVYYPEIRSKMQKSFEKSEE